ncbi:MAG TPA: pectinesterase family protein, partial [Chthoniobacterales bacterium]|nr:pectinesterase family protein [Chthoniobacterales bacterium]
FRFPRPMSRLPRRSMSFLLSRWFLAGGCALLCLAPKTTRARDYLVNPTGPEGTFHNVQSAVNAVSGQSETDRANIFIAPGKYIERVAVDKPFVTFIGQGAAPTNVVISFNGTPMQNGNLGESVSILPGATAFMARNLTFENSTPDASDLQALALRCDADRAIFDNVWVLGYQDTLFVWSSTRQYFRKSWISGDTDFIFGNATAVFDRCTIESNGPGFITAADTLRTTANGLIFLDCKLTNGFSRAPNNSVYLGRPWFYSPQQQMPSVIFIRTRMGPHIKRAGWEPWDYLLDPTINRDPYTRFSEWGSMNLSGAPLLDSNQDGTPDGRVSWADPMTAAQAANYTLQNIFGPVDFWNSTTQPEISNMPYQSQGDPWDPDTQLLSLPARQGAKPQLLNISTRLAIGAGHSVGIGGFIVTGNEPKKVVVRAIGPSLGGAGLANPLPDPVLEIHGGPGDSVIGKNDNWRDDASAAELSSLGLAPADDSEAATVVTLAPGPYTAVITGKNGTPGTALVEVYDADLVADSQFGNISTLGFVGNADDVLIGGFVVGNSPATLVIRAMGPSLSNAGVPNPISDPVLELHTANGSVTSNDDWETGAEAAQIPASLRPVDRRESALHAILAPGHYTAIVRSKDGAAGMGMVEAYNVQ